MADELQENLATYKLQLQQVEASLTTDPDNEDLNKLKKDLQEVIDLTEDLVGNKQLTAIAVDASASGSGLGSLQDIAPAEWKVGDPCLAVWSKDGQLYEAKIDEILEDGTCAITFDSYGNTDVTEVKLLRKIDPSQQKKDADKKPKSKRDQIAEQKEYRRKKQQKKAQRLKQMEEERETEKNKWLDFNTKTFSKTNKGKVKKSIFATPDAVNGKVGVGTCGQGGRPMTSFQHAEKWKK
ncbi:survival of motor neuron-related-splicing factor 30-like [Crassostrea angulata]|uniref:survival of motor neuron-related-splicing factor 30-like n=1 Tax=Magallana angulata TaxID=2784310 RepID=UPI0022B1CA0F|nr:survival of motor neuron-related-splicing factor 30-like [Crassostrea angulata]